MNVLDSMYVFSLLSYVTVHRMTDCLLLFVQQFLMTSVLAKIPVNFTPPQTIVLNGSDAPLGRVP